MRACTFALQVPVEDWTKCLCRAFQRGIAANIILSWFFLFERLRRCLEA